MKSIVKILFYIVLVQTITGCSSEKTDRTLEEIKQQYQAENITFGKSLSASTDTKKQNNIQISITNPLFDNDSIYKMEDIGSNSALLIYESLNEAEKNGIDNIKVNIIQSLNNINKTNSFLYSITELKEIDSIYKSTIIGIAKDFTTQNYDHLLSYYTPEIFDYFPPQKIKDDFINVDKKYGVVKNSRLIGFKFPKATDSKDNPIKVIKYSLFFDRREMRNVVDFYFDFTVTNPKIIKVDF